MISFLFVIEGEGGGGDVDDSGYGCDERGGVICRRRRPDIDGWLAGLLS